jgi:UDP-N-acetylglucosamine 1-carboxyvinyltransferase
MDKFIIEGGVPLNGEVTPAGNKNAALPLLAAALLTNEPIVLRNIPQIQDTRVMRRLIESLGVLIEDLDDTSWRVTARDLRPADLNPDLAPPFWWRVLSRRASANSNCPRPAAT